MAVDTVVEVKELRYHHMATGSWFVEVAAMLAAEEVAILFEQVVATVGEEAATVVAVEERHIGHCLKVDASSLLVQKEEAHIENVVFATSIGLDFEERERLGCARYRRD